MFKGLRWRLTLLYGLVGLALIALIGGGTYQLLNVYFLATADIALDGRAALELMLLGAEVPHELDSAVQEFSTNTPVSLFAGENEDESENAEHGFEDGPFNSELAAVFVVPLDAAGNTLLVNAGLPITPDIEAAQSALTNGFDRRTINVDGTRVRLLTLTVDTEGDLALLQLGRTLRDQDRVQDQLLVGLVVLGAVSVLLLGLGSWILAGRSLQPAQKAWDRQRTFIANASHELRTPLTLIRASAEVAQRSLSDLDRRELLNDVIVQSDHVNRLIEDLLLLSRLDTGRLELKKQVIAVPELLADLERQMGHVVAEKNITLTIDTNVDHLEADRTRLWQVLLILTDNAQRHTPSGGAITVSAQKIDRQIHLEVSDTGRGIAPEHLPHIFERFYQADDAHSADQNGVGLGLSIASAIVEAQGGSVSVASAGLGHGSTFTVVLPG